MQKLLGVAALTLAVFLAGSPSGPSAVAEPRAPARAPLAVTGYILEGSSSHLVDREEHGLHTLGVDGITLASSGASVPKPSAGARRLLKRAHHDGLRSELLVSNYDNNLGDFSPELGSRLLRNRAHIAHVSKRLARFAKKQGWDGIVVDLESLRRADGPGLTRFVRALQKKMPAGKTVSVDVMAATHTADYRAMGYQLRPLGRAADVLALMTYDQHGPGWSGPGPIGALPWQRGAVQALRAKVSAGKIDLGVAGYGYSWPPSSGGRVYSPRQARKVVASDGASAVWHAKQGEWSATLGNGTVLWWSDARSWRLRVKLARTRGLHGLALWRLGLADPLPR